MASSATSRSDGKRRHVIVFVTVAGLLTLLVLFGSVRDLLLLPGQSGFPSTIHRWHEAQSGALVVILFGGSLLALLWKPRSKPVLMQYLVLSIGILCLAFATVSGAGFNPLVLVVGFVVIGILVAAYPWPRDLLGSKREGSLCYPLFAITFLAAILLAPTIAREINYQVVGMAQQDEHAQNYHWLTSAGLSLLLILGGAFASTKRPGWRTMGLVVGIAYVYLGSAALMLPDYVGSWGTTGGALGLFGGVSYIAVTSLEVQRARMVPRVRSVQNDALLQEAVESASHLG